MGVFTKQNEAAHPGRLACFIHARPLRADASLDHVTLPLAVFLHRLASRTHGGEVELHRVTTLGADLVAELEAVDLADVSDHLSRDRRRHWTM